MRSTALTGVTTGRAVALQFKEYLERAEYLKTVIDGQVPAVQHSNGTAQKSKPTGANGGGGSGKDAVRTASPRLRCGRVDGPGMSDITVATRLSQPANRCN